MSDEVLYAPEIVMLIEGLDALLGADDGRLPGRSDPEREAPWAAHQALRGRLKSKVHMSLYDRAGTWIDRELGREREAVADRLFTRLGELVNDPKATRKSIKLDFGKAVREMREGGRQSSPRPLS